MQLVRYEAARQALQEAVRIDEAKDIRDKAVALAEYARQREDADLESAMSRLRIRADIRIGELSRDLVKAKQGGKGGGSDIRNGAKVEALEKAGIKKDTAYRCELLADIYKEQTELVEAEIEKARENNKPIRPKDIHKFGRQQKRKKKNATLRAVPIVDLEGPFELILADPPWQYDFAETDNRNLENQYPTMAVEDICNLEIDIADDAILYLWATSPKLKEGIRVLESWGFTYKTTMVWIKDKIGMGYYARQRHELILIGAKGKPELPEPEYRPDSVIESPRGKHSEKPKILHNMLEDIYPGRSRLEMFARNKRKGWSVWGNQAGV